MQKKISVFFIGFLLSSTIHASDINQNLLIVKIEGISLSTSIDAIPEILDNHGYNQTASTTFTKRTQAAGQRKSIHRIEISDTDKLRQISYIREKSGGRIKSPPKVEEPILENEALIAQEIYRIVCTEVSAQVQNERHCQPASKSSININKGNALQIGSDFEVTLNASAANTAVRLKYSKK